MKKLLAVLLVAMLTIGLIPGISFAEVIELKMYYPVQVAGAMATIIDGLCAEFNAEHPDIHVEAIYSGDYTQTLQRVLTASNADNPADLALVNDFGIWSCFDEDAIICLDEFVEAEGGEAFSGQFWPAYWNACCVKGQAYAIPFQKSVPLFYYNKDMFREAGLDPESPPRTWDELYAACEKLTEKDSRGNTTRWGIVISSSDSWQFSFLSLGNGAVLTNDERNEVYIDTPETRETMYFVKSLVDAGFCPASYTYGDCSSDFAAGQTAMMFHSSGNLTFQRESCPFDWGTAELVYNTTPAGMTGGGELVIMKNIPESHQKAAWELIKWLTTAERAAQWCIDTGYVATRPDAFETERMKNYLAEFPQLETCRTELSYAVCETPVTHDGAHIVQIMTDAWVGILTGKTTVEEGLAAAQAEADKSLSRWRTE